MTRAVKAAVGRRGVLLPVRVPGRAGRLMAEGGLLPGDDAVRGTQTFAEWLDDLAAHRRARGSPR